MRHTATLDIVEQEPSAGHFVCGWREGTLRIENQPAPPGAPAQDPARGQPLHDDAAAAGLAAPPPDARSPGPPQVAAHRGGPLSAMRHRDFRVLLLSTMAEQIGSWVQTVAMGWLVLEDLHGNATQLGVVALLRGASLLLLSPVGGYLTTRWEQRRQLVAYTGAGAVVAFVLAVLIAADAITIWIVFLAAALSGAATALATPLRLARVYESVDAEDLTNAVALNALAGNAMRVVGPAIGGVLIGTVGTQGAFQLQAAMLVVAALITLQIRPRRSDAAHARNGIFREIGGGVRYVAGDPAMVVIVLMAIIPSLLLYPYVTFLPVFAHDVMHAGGRGYGFLAAGVGVGSLVGGVLVITVITRGPIGRRAMLACMGYAAFVGVFTLTRSVIAGVAVLACAGLFHSVYSALNQSQLQLRAPARHRPQVMAIQSMIQGTTPFAALLMGAMVDRWEAPNVVAGWAIVAFVLVGALFVVQPRVVPASKPAQSSDWAADG